VGALSKPSLTSCKPVIGLAGGIGAGKSTVAGLFQEAGAAVIDADRMVRELLEQSEVVATIGSWWPEAVRPDGEGLDRGVIADIVFRQPEACRRLEQLLYPRIERRQADLIAGYQRDPAVRAVVIDAPKLFEAGFERYCDAVLYVEADRRVRVDRVVRARGWTETELQRRENLQYSLERKRAKADFVIVNNSDIDDLRARVNEVLSAILTAFPERRDRDDNPEAPR